MNKEKIEKYGCIGKKLTHSFSKEIHEKLADYEYRLIELNEEDIPMFFQNRDFSAINVTIPYKQTVIPHIDSVSAIARRIGAVNTVINKNGTLYGYNTDYYGMKALIEKANIELSGKKVLILGTGGTSKTAFAVASDLGAAEILIVSRRKDNGLITYEEAISKHSDADVIINTTPCGMYPECESTPIDITHFYKLSGLIDAVYNPLSTNLVSDAKKRGIKAEGGLYMLVMQAVKAVEKFIDCEISESKAQSVYSQILFSKENVILIGMPGCGKSTVGQLLNIDGFEFFDTDAEIEKRCGCSIKELIYEKGEKYFRDLETEVIREISKECRRVIATGGGAVLRKENVDYLKRNGKLYFIDADINRLFASDDRPLSDTREKLEKLYSERIEIYRTVADFIIPDMLSPEEIAQFILKKRTELKP